ncbi:hypothetical protein QE364_000019 [Nocardioides zeae]|uniref:Uncharacterized protein n=1 Tax=Nocardioides zeae TaxID=1457234 RepID=A0ACC6IC87_9ACTN|nr:DUF5994 family protein [Nocardioides zeae]MDR6175398.1 hypothetical protein [Nocardioides zeae]MDR6208331.1 hypothetical protein [Nocardioides zeae]
MAPRSAHHSAELVISADPGRAVCGAFWPQNRRLGEQLDRLLTLWPRGQELGTLSTVIYCPVDWEGGPSTVIIRRRRYLTTYLSAGDDSHLLTLVRGTRPPRHVEVIAHDTDPRTAEAVLLSYAGPGAGADLSRRAAVRRRPPFAR